MPVPLTTTEARIVERLRDGPCDTDVLQAAAGITSRKSLHVMVHRINTKGFTVKCQKRWAHGSVGSNTGQYHLVTDPEPPFVGDYLSMARSMGAAA